MVHARPTKGTCLGTGDYFARVVARKTPKTPARPVGEFDLLESGSWGRTVDATSSGQVTLTLTPGCCETLGKIRPLRHELEIFRDDDMVWAGPILTRTVDQQEEIATIDARDLSYWLNLRLFQHTMRPRGVDLADIFKGYIDYAFARGLPEWGEFQDGDPPLYIDDPGLELHVTPTGVTGDRTVYHHDLKIVASELQELADTGIDWTVIGRHMLAGSQEVSDRLDGDPLVLPNMMTDDDYDTPARVRETGEGMAYMVWTRGNGVRVPLGGPADEDGIEIVRVLDEYSIEDVESATAAAQSYLDRGTLPLLFIEGQGGLSESSPVSIDQLVAGARVRASFDGAECLPVNQVLRLDAVDVTFGPEGEKVNPTLEPLGAAGADARGAGG